MSELSGRHGIYLAGGFAERHRGHVYDSLVFCTPRGEVSIYRKRHLIFWEHFYFRAGRDPLIVETEWTTSRPPPVDPDVHWTLTWSSVLTVTHTAAAGR